MVTSLLEDVLVSCLDIIGYFTYLYLASAFFFEPSFVSFYELRITLYFYFLI